MLIPRFLHKETRHAKDVALAERTILLDAQNNTPTIQDLSIKRLKAEIEALKTKHESEIETQRQRWKTEAYNCQSCVGRGL
ncbi:hypothetical protein G6514_008857 [Epicoccum nigrum]|nr:hypothetical protein G6514_008857 [Epicoccum nigrum]